jgi:hypothetical protein
MTEDPDGTYHLSPAECAIVAGVAEMLVEVMRDIPDDTPIPEPLLAALCREARRLYDERTTGH